MLDFAIIKNNEIVETNTINTSHIAKTQRDYARKRTKIQKHIKNPAKRIRKLKEARHRQRNIVRDKLQKLTTGIVKDNEEKTFVFEDLTNIKKKGEKNKDKKHEKDGKASYVGKKKQRSKRFRTDINIWPYRLFQMFVDYKSKNETLYVDPEGTSSECPVCGGRLKHPIWKISECDNCGVTFDRDRLSSLSIAVRGLHLCGTPFTVSGGAPWDSTKDNYLYRQDQVVIEDSNACKREMHNISRTDALIFCTITL